MDTFYVYDILEWEYEDKWINVETDKRMFLESCLDDKFPKIIDKKGRER